MKLILFTRYKYDVNDENYVYSINYKIVRSSYFLTFIRDLCNKSQVNSSYINVYEIVGRNKINKLAFISLGKLFTL